MSLLQRRLSQKSVCFLLALTSGVRPSEIVTLVCTEGHFYFLSQDMCYFPDPVFLVKNGYRMLGGTVTDPSSLSGGTGLVSGSVPSVLPTYHFPF